MFSFYRHGTQSALSVLFLLSCILVTGCRSYLGSDNLTKYEWGEEKITDQEENLKATKGVVVSVKEKDELLLHFAIRSYSKYTIQQDLFKHEGKKYYYNVPYIGNAMVYGVFLPFSIIWDLVTTVGDYSPSQRYKGQNPPSLFYRTAYLPIVRLFFQPFLFSPYGYTGSQCLSFHTETEESYDSRSKAKIRCQDIYTPAFKSDNSQGNVTITGGGKVLKKKMDANGLVTIKIEDLFPSVDPLQTITLKVHHDQWNMDWIIEAPFPMDYDAIRNWNIFVNERYDYLTRMQALMYLKAFMNDSAYRKYCQLLLDGKVNRNDTPILPTSISVRPQQ